MQVFLLSIDSSFAVVVVHVIFYKVFNIISKHFSRFLPIVIYNISNNSFLHNESFLVFVLDSCCFFTRNYQVFQFQYQIFIFHSDFKTFSILYSNNMWSIINSKITQCIQVSHLKKLRQDLTLWDRQYQIFLRTKSLINFYFLFAF